MPKSRISEPLSRKYGNEEKLTIRFSLEEFWFLLQQFSPTVILGMENPYLGWLVDDIKTAQRKVLKSLIDRDLVRKISKDEIELDDVLATMVGVCAHPEHSLIVQFQNGKSKNTQRFIHFENNLIVEQFEFEPGQQRLTAIKDRNALTSYLNEVLRLSTTTVSSGGKFRLPEDTLFEAKSLCNEGHARKALNSLKKVGVPEGKATALTTALTNPIANTAFVVLSNRNKTDLQHVKGFALLESESDLWIMLPFDKNKEKMVEFIPANAKLIKQHFLEILP